MFAPGEDTAPGLGELTLVGASLVFVAIGLSCPHSVFVLWISNFWRFAGLEELAT